jgi:hypothetical protein
MTSTGPTRRTIDAYQDPAETPEKGNPIHAQIRGQEGRE